MTMNGVILGCCHVVCELEGVAMEPVDMYNKSLPLSSDLDVQESMHGEELLTMASNILVQLFWRSQKHGYILEAVMVLELGLTVRRIDEETLLCNVVRNLTPSFSNISVVALGVSILTKIL